MNDNFNATNSASVFFCSDGSVPFPSTVPEERAKELSSIGNATVKREKEAVWGLLLAAIGSLGMNPDDVTFGQTENGKWVCDKFFFSLSHSHGAVAVAISDNPCGIDVEKRSEFMRKCADKTFCDKLQRKIAATDSSFETLIKTWTAKETEYKRIGSGGYYPAGILIDETKIRHIEIGDFLLCVSCNNPQAVRIRIFSDGRISEAYLTSDFSR